MDCRVKPDNDELSQNPVSTRTFGLPGSVAFDTTVGISERSTGHCWAARSRKRSSVAQTEKMHRDDDLRFQRGENFHHAIEIERVVAVDRRHHHVDAADLVELLLGERVMQMAEMGDAQVRDLEHEDRIAVTLGAAGQSRISVGTLRTRTSRYFRSQIAGSWGSAPSRAARI